MAEFLHASSSQLTTRGIAALSEAMEAGQLAVFFRNNHFNTLFKHPAGDLFILVTDEGYVKEEGLMWERVDDAKGNSTFFYSDFSPYTVRCTGTQV
jgi:ubiquitin carboxyl-terminal hydrolase MINDY-1/2